MSSPKPSPEKGPARQRLMMGKKPMWDGPLGFPRDAPTAQGPRGEREKVAFGDQHFNVGHLVTVISSWGQQRAELDGPSR